MYVGSYRYNSFRFFLFQLAPIFARFFDSYFNIYTLFLLSIEHSALSTPIAGSHYYACILSKPVDANVTMSIRPSDLVQPISL